MEDNKSLRLLHKDQNAEMEQLMNQYTGLVYAVVKSKLADSYYVSSDIEDCVADVFSKFYADLSDYDPKISSIKTYLCVIARNQAINVSKRRNLEGGISLDDEQSLLQVADDVMIHSELPSDAVVTLQKPSVEYPLKDGKTTFYVCQKHSCLPPVNDWKVALGK